MWRKTSHLLDDSYSPLGLETKINNFLVAEAEVNTFEVSWLMKLMMKPLSTCVTYL